MNSALPTSTSIDRRRGFQRLAALLIATIVCLPALLATQAKAEVRVTAQHGGYVEDAVVVGEFAYVAQGSSIATLRLGDSTDPLEVASVSEPLGGEVRAVAVYRDRLYASWGDSLSSSGLSLFSLDDPARPSFLSHLEIFAPHPFYPEGMIVVGDTLYVLSYSDLLPFDLSNPDQPAVGVPADAAGKYRLTHYGDHHLVAWGPAPSFPPPGYVGALIFDLSAPLAPVEVAGIVGGFHHDLDAGDGFIVSSGRGFRVFDLTDPTDPTSVSSVSGVDGVAGELVGRHYLVADGDTIRTWDLADLASPVEVATVSAPVSESAWAFHGGERALFFTDLGRAVELDVTDPSDPALASSLDLPVGPSPIALDPVGSQYYVADSRRGLRLLNAKMRTLADLGSEWPSVSDMSVDGPRALFADFAYGVRYVDVSNPLSPVLLGAVPLDETRSVELDGDRGWVVAGNSDPQLMTLDLSTPDDPQIIHSTPLGGDSKLFNSGDLLYVADGGSPGGLRTFDVSGAVPVQLSRFVGCQPRDVDVFGSIAALVCVGDEMQLLDVSNPAEPVPLSVYEPAQSPFLVTSVQFAADGQVVYLGFLGGVDLVDVSNPASPVQTQRLEVGGWIDELEADSEGRIWAVGGEAGLARIDEVGPVFGSLAKPALRSFDPKSTAGQGDP